MTGRSKRELERRLDDLDDAPDSSGAEASGHAAGSDLPPEAKAAVREILAYRYRHYGDLSDPNRTPRDAILTETLDHMPSDRAARLREDLEL